MDVDFLKNVHMFEAPSIEDLEYSKGLSEDDSLEFLGHYCVETAPEAPLLNVLSL